MENFLQNPESDSSTGTPQKEDDKTSTGSPTPRATDKLVEIFTSAISLGFSSEVSRISKELQSELREEYKKEFEKIKKEQLVYSKQIIDNAKSQIEKDNQRTIKNAVDKSVRDEVEKSRIGIIETLAIFVALFTFVSLQFQAFASQTSLMAITGITLVMLGGLLAFIVILDLVINPIRSNFKNKTAFFTVFIFIIIFIAIGISFSYISKKDAASSIPTNQAQALSNNKSSNLVK